MSHFTYTTTQFRDKEALIAALKIICPLWEVKDFDTPIHLYGYQGGKRDDVAHLIIRRICVGEMSNDVGFIYRDGVYHAIVSEYDQGYLKFNSRILPALKREYSRQVVIGQCKRKGWTYTERVNEAGHKQIVVNAPSKSKTRQLTRR